jgi:hypothetical protein
MIQVGSKIYEDDEFTANIHLGTREHAGRGQLVLTTFDPDAALILRYEVPPDYKGPMTPRMIGWRKIEGKDFIDSYPKWSSIVWVSEIDDKAARAMLYGLSMRSPRWRRPNAIYGRLEEFELGSGPFIMTAGTRRRNSQWLKLFRMMGVEVKRKNYPTSKNRTKGEKDNC